MFRVPTIGMRSRPELELLLPKVIFPGDRVPFELRLHSRSVTPVDRISVWLEGTETMTGPSGNDRYRHSERFLSLGCELAQGVTLGETTHAYTSDFTLPGDAPFSYAGPHLTIGYRLTAHVDIPWWPDALETYTVPVLPAFQSRPFRRTPVTHTTARGGEPFLEVQLDDDVFSPGDPVRGAIAAGNLQGGTIRRVDLAFVGVESTEHGYHSYTREAARYTASLPPGDMAVGQALPFSIEVPKGAFPTFATRLGRLGWFFEVRLVRAWKSDLSIQIPITIMPFDHPAQRTEWTPRVGETRWREVFRFAAESNGLTLSPDTLEIQGRIGDVTIRVDREQEGGRLGFVAQLDWEGWGIDFGLERRMLPFGGIDLPDDLEGFGSRFRVRGREPAQVRAALVPPLRQAILAFEEVRFGDDHATVRRAAQSNDDVLGFVTAIAALARELNAAEARIPEPLSLWRAVPAWRALAEELGGRLWRGGMRVRGVFEGSRIEIATRFGDGPEPVGAELAVELDPPLDRGVDAAQADALAALPAAAKELLKQLQEDGRKLEVRPEAMRLAVPAVVEDPATLLPLASSMLALARRLRGDLRAGPYR